MQLKLNTFIILCFLLCADLSAQNSLISSDQGGKHKPLTEQQISNLKESLAKKLPKTFCLTADLQNQKITSPIKFNLGHGDCHTISHKLGLFEEFSFCFEEVLEDSRCPPDVQCVRAGRAILKFVLTLKDTEEHDLVLGFGQDTIINQTIVLLSSISPKGVEHKAEIVLADLEKLESNAKIIGYRPYQQGVCSGWLINMHGDTIISNDHKLRSKLKRDAEYPINAFIEKSKIDVERCSNKDMIKAYWLSRIIILD